MASTKVPSALEKLPAEILEAIVVWLQFQDICSLRLSSRVIAARSVQKTWKKYFASKTVDWTSTKQLQELIQMTKPQGMGCYLQNLYIVGTVSARVTQSNKDLLADAFTNLRLNSAHGGLKSIVLSVQGRADNGNIRLPKDIRDWESVWQTASQTFEIACQALADSALRVQKVDIYNGTIRCSLACNKIALVQDYPNISGALANLTCVSLSLSNHLEDDPESQASNSMSHGQHYTRDIKRFLDLCCHLETLELHWHRLQYRHGQNEIQTESFFTEIAKLDHLSQLRHCRLSGIRTDEATLIDFFKQATQLSSLTMEEIHLKTGRFAPVFSHLTTQSPYLEYLHLCDLYESRHICFDGPGKSRFPSTRPNGPETLTRTGVACQSPIGYRPTEGRNLGSGVSWRWNRMRELLYGPLCV